MWLDFMSSFHKTRIVVVVGGKQRVLGVVQVPSDTPQNVLGSKAMACHGIHCITQHIEFAGG